MPSGKCKLIKSICITSSLNCWRRVLLKMIALFWLSCRSFSAAITRRLWATPEAEIIRSSRDVLSAIDSPKELATTLYGKGLIDFHTKERIHQLPLTLTEQRERLLDAVENQCRTNSRTFHEFVTVLKQEPTTQYVACLLQKCKKSMNLLCYVAKCLVVLHTPHCFPAN